MVVIEGCDMLQEVLFNESSLTEYQKELKIDNLEQLNVCLYGNGNVAEYYNITSDLDILGELENKTLEFKQLRNNISLEDLNATEAVIGPVYATLNYSVPADENAVSVQTLALLELMGELPGT